MVKEKHPTMSEIEKKKISEYLSVLDRRVRLREVEENCITFLQLVGFTFSLFEPVLVDVPVNHIDVLVAGKGEEISGVIHSSLIELEGVEVAISHQCM